MLDDNFICNICYLLFMVKAINIRRIPDSLYFKVLTLKAQMNARNWIEFLEKVIKANEK